LNKLVVGVDVRINMAPGEIKFAVVPRLNTEQIQNIRNITPAITLQ